MNWPIGMGQNFFGIIDRKTKQLSHLEMKKILHLNDDFELQEAHAIRMIVHLASN